MRERVSLSKFASPKEGVGARVGNDPRGLEGPSVADRTSPLNFLAILTTCRGENTLRGENLENAPVELARILKAPGRDVCLLVGLSLRQDGT